MATKQEPVQKTFRFPLIGTFQNRNALGTQDQRFINFFPESIKNAVTDNKKIYLVKRPGLALSYQLAAGVGRGMYGWNGFNYAVVGDKVYKDSTLLITLTTSTGHVGFTEATNATGTVLFMHDGTYGYVIYDDDSYIRIPETLSAWAGTTAYIASDRIIPTVDNGFYYSPTVGGVSAGSQPTWPTTIGDTVTDGTITWECMGYYDPDGLPKNALPYPVYLDGSIFLIARRTDGSNSQSIFSIYSSLTLLGANPSNNQTAVPPIPDCPTNIQNRSCCATLVGAMHPICNVRDSLGASGEVVLTPL